MVEYNAGDAKLRVVPDASKFKTELEAKLDAMKVDFTVRLNIELAQAKADMTRFRSEENNRNLNQRVNPQFSRAREELAAFRAEQRANAIEVPVHADTSGGTGGATQAGRAFGSAFSSGASSAMSAIKPLAILGLIANVPAVVTALASVTQAIGQLSGAALVLPGAMATAGASIGTLALGLSGVGDAWTAMSAASSQSSSTLASNAQAVTSAQNALSNAVQDEKHAQDDVTNARNDARRSLEDLNLELRGGQISEAQAINDAQKARRDLAKGGFKDALDATDAQLRVQAADQRVAESRQRNIELQQDATKENAKGIEGSDQVVAANERLVRSQEAVQTAQFSLTQILTNGDAATAKATELLGKLAPNAQAFLKAVQAIKPEWDALKNTVQGNLFEGAADSFTNFVNSILPNMKSGLGSIASAWNVNIKTLLSSLGNDSSKGLLDRILGNTAEAQSRFNKAIDPLVKGIGTLLGAGSDAIPRLADAIGSVAERFSAFITAADQDGRLAGWIDKGLTGFADLGEILLNIGKSFFSINEALGGEGLLGSLRQVTEKMATWLGSDAGQAKLKAFFQEGRAELDKWKPIAENLIDILPAIWKGAKDAMDVFMPILTKISGYLADHPNLVETAVKAFALFETIKLAGLLGVLGNVTKAIGLGGKGGGGIIGKLFLALAAFDLLDGFLKDSGGQDSTAVAALPGAQPPPAGVVPPGSADRPVGQPAPFSNVPGAGVDKSTLKDVAPMIAAGGLAALVTPGGPLVKGGAAIVASILAAPDAEVSKLSEQDKDFNTIVGAIPNIIEDATLQPTADLFGLSPEELRKTPRGELYKLYVRRMTASANGKPLPGAPAPFTPPAPGQPVTPYSPPSSSGLPTDNPFAGYETGGPTNAGLAVLHDDEFVLSKRASKYPDAFKHALNEGRIDPSSLPHFDNGGSHLQPGAPGPGPGNAGVSLPAVAAAPAMPAAPAFNIGSFFGNMLGIPALGNLGGVGADGQPTPIFGKADDGRTTIGGHSIGLDPKLLESGDNDAKTNAQTYLKNWGMNTLQSLGRIALDGNGNGGGILGGLGLENSVLSPNNSWNQAAQQGLGFVMGGGAGGAGDIGSETISVGNGGESITIPTYGTSGTANGGSPGASKGGEGGLQIKTIAIKHAIESRFPQVLSIGGYRKDPLQWHPSGRALDVMVSNLGNNDKPTPPGPRALGDAVYAWALGPGVAMGVYPAGTIWQKPDHYNHVHVALLDGGGYPAGGGPGGGGSGAGTTAGGGAPKKGWFDKGGLLAPGVTMAINHTGQNERILNPAQNAQYEAMLPHFELGGAFKLGSAPIPVPKPPPVPVPQMPQMPDIAKQMIPRIASTLAPPPQTPATAPDQSAPAQPPQTDTPAPQPNVPRQEEGPAGPAPNASAGGQSHLLPAVETGIKSGAATLGNIASAAASMGMMGMGGGGMGGMISGLFNVGGKVVTDAANVAASFLVGSTTLGGNTGSAYGQTYQSKQTQPATAQNHHTTNYNGGIVVSDPQEMRREMDLRDAQHTQSIMANH